MRTPARGTRLRRSAAPFAGALALAALVAGCGGTATSREGADAAGGKELFQQKCGACHVLSDAGTQGQSGPNLDHAFGASREQGFEESTFFEVTLQQMQIPGAPMPQFDEPADEANYLAEEDRVAVAAYVASVAGKPGAGDARQAEDPKSIFTASCGSCHTLADAETMGATGPNLDDTKPGLEEAARQIAKGGNGMPPFEGQLTDEQIQALAEYIVEATGGRRR